MKKEEKNVLLAEIVNLKKALMTMRIKFSSGDFASLKNYKKTKKEIAKLFTKINNKPTKVA